MGRIKYIDQSHKANENALQSLQMILQSTQR